MESEKMINEKQLKIFLTKYSVPLEDEEIPTFYNDLNKVFE